MSGNPWMCARSNKPDPSKYYVIRMKPSEISYLHYYLQYFAIYSPDLNLWSCQSLAHPVKNEDVIVFQEFDTKITHVEIGNDKFSMEVDKNNIKKAPIVGKPFNMTDTFQTRKSEVTVLNVIELSDTYIIVLDGV